MFVLRYHLQQPHITVTVKSMSEVFLRKTLDHKLLPVQWAAPCLAAATQRSMSV